MAIIVLKNGKYGHIAPVYYSVHESKYINQMATNRYL